MKPRNKKPLIAEREIMTEAERDLLARDITHVAGEYFEIDGQASIDIARTESGYSVCILLDARRIKKLFRLPY